MRNPAQHAVILHLKQQIIAFIMRRSKKIPKFFLVYFDGIFGNFLMPMCSLLWINNNSMTKRKKNMEKKHRGNKYHCTQVQLYISVATSMYLLPLNWFEGMPSNWFRLLCAFNRYSVIWIAIFVFGRCWMFMAFCSFGNDIFHWNCFCIDRNVLLLCIFYWNSGDILWRDCRLNEGR